MKKREDTNLYEKKITLGRDASGKVVRRSIYARTKAELEKKIFAARQDYMADRSIKSESMLFSLFAKQWLEEEKSTRSIATRYMYTFTIEHYLNPEIGDLLLSEITQSDLLGLMSKHLNKYETCNKIRLTLKQIIASAEDHGLISPGKLRPAKLPLPAKPATKKRALSEDEKQALFAADLDDKERMFVLTLYYTGVRKEEALALVPEAFNLKDKTVTVSQVRVRDGYGARIEKTAKNHYSLRTIPLPDPYIAVLTHYAVEKGAFLFGMDKDRALMTESSFRRFWSGIIKKLSVICPTAADLTPHMFRHNYATMLYYSDISLKMAAKLLGHANTTMIMRIYAHLDEQKENTAEKLNAVFS